MSDIGQRLAIYMSFSVEKNVLSGEEKGRLQCKTQLKDTLIPFLFSSLILHNLIILLNFIFFLPFVICPFSDKSTLEIRIRQSRIHHATQVPSLSNILGRLHS